ncbi:MAG: dienelactone hydrolase family protein [Terriglobia bacterium]
MKIDQGDTATVRSTTIAAIQPGTSKTQMVAFPSEDEETSGFLVLPAKAYRHWAIIAVHEWWGLNDWLKEQARNLAANGYIVLAVDLYRGKVTSNRFQARKLKRSLPEDRAIRDIKAAFNYLVARPDVDPKRIGSIGWSMGGQFALQLAVHEPRLAACVVNYGALPTNPADIQKIHAQVLGSFGALDREISPTKVRTFENVMKTLNKSVDIKIYAGAGHAFANPNNKRGYRPAAAADAWFRTLTFYARVIGEAGTRKHRT